MKFFIRMLFSLLVTLGFYSSSMAAAAISAKTPVASVEMGGVVSVNESEIRLLRQQLEDSRKFQEQILSAVYWSLGTLATVAALLVSFGWFANFKIYERDKVIMERELRALADANMAGLNSMFNMSLVKNTSELYKGLDSRINSAIEQYDRKQVGILASLEEKLDFLTGESRAGILLVKEEVLGLKLASQIEKREMWLKIGIFENALGCSLIALKLATEIRSEYLIGECLGHMFQDVNILTSKPENMVDNYLVANLIKELDLVKGSNAHVAAVIKTKVTTLVTKK